jgi:hypothetical protein
VGQPTRPMRHETRKEAIDEIDVREIAAELRRDVRTVRKVARGEPIRGIVAAAEIRRAIEARRRERSGCGGAS